MPLVPKTENLQTEMFPKHKIFKLSIPKIQVLHRHTCLSYSIMIGY